MALQQDSYPLYLSVDYPDKPLNRLSLFFRLIAMIPIAIVLSLVASGSLNIDDIELNATGSCGSIVFATMLMILFRRKYPMVVRLEPGSPKIHNSGRSAPPTVER